MTAIANPPGSLSRRQRRRNARWLRRQARLNKRRPPRKSRLGECGTARGQIISVGSVESGWTAPPPVVLNDGTSVRLFKDGQGLTAGLEAIKSAREQVCLEVYIFHSDDTGRAFANALADKARSGVRVFLIYDSFGCSQSDPAMFQMMRQAGIHMAEFHPLRYWDCNRSWRPLNRDHRKLLVIDNAVAGLGGLNVGSEYGSGFLSPSAHKQELWRDNAISIVGPAAKILAECFSRAWRYARRDGPIRNAEMVHGIQLETDGSAEPAPTSTSSKPAAIPVYSLTSDFCLLASAPVVRSPLAPFLSALLQNARRSIDLTIAYFAPSNALIKELIASSRRGVHVRLMLPGKSDIRLARFAAQSFYESLLNAGIEIWERQDAVLHAKTMVIDRQLTMIGSVNLDYRSIEYNCELSTIIRNDNFGLQMAELFAHDTNHAKKIASSNWRSRPLLDRVVQWAANQVRHLL